MSTRTFVPAQLDPTTFASFEPLFVSLENREIHSPAELEKWLLDCSELHDCLMLQREIVQGIYCRCPLQVGFEQPAHMFSDHVRLDVHPASRL